MVVRVGENGLKEKIQGMGGAKGEDSRYGGGLKEMSGVVLRTGPGGRGLECNKTRFILCICKPGTMTIKYLLFSCNSSNLELVSRIIQFKIFLSIKILT